MWVGGKRYVIDYSKADKLYHVSRLETSGPVVLSDSYTSYLEAEREVKLDFLSVWVQQYVKEHPDKLWHGDEQFEEVERDPVVNSEYYAFFSSPSHHTTFRYYIEFAEDYTFTPNGVEVSVLAECRACDHEWSQNHPHPHG